MDPRTLAGTAAATGLAAAAGSWATTPSVQSSWYRRLRKPAIQPPPAVFPVVWTALYTDIAVTSAYVLDRLPAEEAEAYLRALTVNLLLNASWSWTFFRQHEIARSVAVAAALTASSLDLARRAAETDRRAGLALVPYAAWCGFATVLTAALWWRNR